MNIDSFFSIGNSHNICEDYALSQLNCEIPFFAIADGCSQNEHTDIGSRLLSWSAFHVFQSIGKEIKKLSSFKIGKLIIEKAWVSAQNLNLPITSLNSTLLIGWKDDEHTHVLAFGDGAIFYKLKNQDYDFSIIDYSKNKPFYLTYLLGDLNKFKNEEQIKTVKSKNIEKECDNLCVSEYSFKNEDLDWLFLTSDGLLSFEDKTDFSKEVEESFIFDEIVNFKNFNGEFLKRRSKRFLKNLKKDSIENVDDFSIAGINFK